MKTCSWLMIDLFMHKRAPINLIFDSVHCMSGILSLLFLLQNAFIHWDGGRGFEFYYLLLHNYISMECQEIRWKMGDNEYIFSAICYTSRDDVLLLVREAFISFLFKFSCCYDMLGTVFSCADDLLWQVHFCSVANMGFLDTSSSGKSLVCFWFCWKFFM